MLHARAVWDRCARAPPPSRSPGAPRATAQLVRILAERLPEPSRVSDVERLKPGIDRGRERRAEPGCVRARQASCGRRLAEGVGRGASLHRAHRVVGASDPGVVSDVETGRVPEAKADVLHAIYNQIVVWGRTIVSIRLTPSAYAHGLALALPTKVALACPTGFEPTRAHPGKTIPIEGADDWEVATMHSA